jgi:hypothetical protein
MTVTSGHRLRRGVALRPLTSEVLYLDQSAGFGFSDKAQHEVREDTTGRSEGDTRDHSCRAGTTDRHFTHVKNAGDLAHAHELLLTSRWHLAPLESLSAPITLHTPRLGATSLGVKD